MPERFLVLVTSGRSKSDSQGNLTCVISHCRDNRYSCFIRAFGAGVIVKTLNVITLAVIIIGGIYCLLAGLPQTTLARLIYVIVGPSAVWQIAPWARALSLDEARAEQARPL